MKKLLSLTVLFAMFSFTHLNANTNQDPSEPSQECLQDAWDFGTKYGGGDADDEYLLTDAYAREHCGVE